MLLLYLQENDRDDLRRLNDLFQQALLNHDFEARITCCEEQLQNIVSNLYGRDEPGLFVVSSEDESQMNGFVKALRIDNPAHYLVLIMTMNIEAFATFSPSYRPSGFLFRPVESNMIENLLRSVYNDYSRNEANSREIIQIKIKNSALQLPYKKILFFESANKKVIARTEGQQYEFYDSLESIARESPDYFLRIHKSYCVNLLCVHAIDYTSNTISMSDGSVIYISRTYKSALKERIRELNPRLN